MKIILLIAILQLCAQSEYIKYILFCVRKMFFHNCTCFIGKKFISIDK